MWKKSSRRELLTSLYLKEDIGDDTVYGDDESKPTDVVANFWSASEGRKNRIQALRREVSNRSYVHGPAGPRRRWRRQMRAQIRAFVSARVKNLAGDRRAAAGEMIGVRLREKLSKIESSDATTESEADNPFVSPVLPSGASGRRGVVRKLHPFGPMKIVGKCRKWLVKRFYSRIWRILRMLKAILLHRGPLRRD